MGTLAAFLVAMVGPLVARVLVALGISMVVTTGAVVSLAAVKNLVIANIAGIPAAGLQLGGLFGLWQGIGIVFGAYTFGVAWKGTSGFWSFAKK